MSFKIGWFPTRNFLLNDTLKIADIKVQILSTNNISLLIKCGYYKWLIMISTFISTIYLKIQITNPSRNISRYILRAGYI
jgi:hypothetical protein